MNIMLRICPGDEELVVPARAFLQGLGGTDVERMSEAAKAVTPREIGPGEIVQIVLAVPSSAWALIALSDRLSRGRGRKEAKNRIEPPLTRLREKAQDSGRIILLEVGNRTLDLGRSSLDEVLDALAASAASPRK